MEIFLEDLKRSVNKLKNIAKKESNWTLFFVPINKGFWLKVEDY
jgi:hypothetical protein